MNNKLKIIILIPFVFITVLASAEEKTDANSNKKIEEIFTLAEITVKESLEQEVNSSNLLEYNPTRTELSDKEIESRNQSTLGETMSLMPGVRNSSYGQGAGRPIVRGFSGDRVKVLKNGISSGDVSELSEDHLVAVNPLQSEKIEIIRGAEALAYGSSAIGGIVNIADNTIPEKKFKKDLNSEILSQFGNSADNEKTISTSIYGNSDNLSWYSSAFSQGTDDYEISNNSAESKYLIEQEIKEGKRSSYDNEKEDLDSKVLNTATQSSGANFGASHIWDKGFIGTSISGIKSNYGIPGHSHAEHDEEHDLENDLEHHDEHTQEHDSDYEDHHMKEEHTKLEHSHSEEEENTRIESEQVKIDIKGKFVDVNKYIQAVKFKSAFTHYQHDETDSKVISTRFNKDRFDLRSEFIHSPIKAFNKDIEGYFGFQYSHEDFSAKGNEIILSPTKTSNPALFTFNKINLNKNLNMQFSSRLEDLNHNPLNSNLDKSFTPFSFSFGPNWHPFTNKNYEVSLNFVHSERAPSASELYSNGPHLARKSYERGNINLGIESSNGIDLVLKKNNGILTSQITPFIEKFSNYINLKNTNLEDKQTDLPIFTYEEIDANIWGFEFVNSLNIDQIFKLKDDKLKLDYQLDYLRATNETNNSYLPRTPPLRNVLRGRYSFLKNYEFMLETVHVSNQDKLDNFELPTDSYTSLNSEINYIKNISNDRSLKLFARGFNLSNEEIRIHNSFLKDTAPQRGRSFLFGLKFDF